MSAEKYVCNQAKIECQMCTNPQGTLMVTSNTIKLQGKLWATEKDKEKTNLMFQGTCKQSPQQSVPCIAVIQTGQWQGTGDVFVQGSKALLESSTIMCNYGGATIKIKDDLQKSQPSSLLPTAIDGITPDVPVSRVIVTSSLESEDYNDVASIDNSGSFVVEEVVNEKSNTPLRKGEVFLNKKSGIIEIYNEIFCYGSKSTKELAEQIASDIEFFWNNSKTKIEINNEKYQIKFTIKGNIINSKVKETILKNKYNWKKYIRIEDKTEASVSYVDGLGSNTGFFQLKNIEKANSTTEAHEFGHTWGLDHPTNHDYRKKGTPHIMLPRGTLVDKKFQYNSKVKAGEYGGTINPKYRKVLKKNIDDLKINQLKFKNNWSNLSKLTNKYHEKLS